MPRYLTHLTITTGHSRRSWRHEIDAGVWPAIVELLERAIAAGDGGAIEIPGDPPGCALGVTVSGRCLLASVHSPEESGARVPLATFGVAAHSRCGASLWRLLTSVPTPIDAGECPAEPWCAVRLHEGIGVWPAAAHWLGDLERCLAWAWLERVDGRRRGA